MLTHDESQVEEDFVGFYETASTTAEVLVNVIKDVLLRCDLKLSHCRGQTYDGAAAMSGVRTGVATRIQAEEKRAINTRCLAHSLNLAVQDATNWNSLIGDVLMAVQELNTRPFIRKKTCKQSLRRFKMRFHLQLHP